MSDSEAMNTAGPSNALDRAVLLADFVVAANTERPPGQPVRTEQCPPYLVLPRVAERGKDEAWHQHIIGCAWCLGQLERSWAEFGVPLPVMVRAAMSDGTEDLLPKGTPIALRAKALAALTRTNDSVRALAEYVADSFRHGGSVLSAQLHIPAASFDSAGSPILAEENQLSVFIARGKGGTVTASVIGPAECLGKSVFAVITSPDQVRVEQPSSFVENEHGVGVKALIVCDNINALDVIDIVVIGQPE